MTNEPERIIPLFFVLLPDSCLLSLLQGGNCKKILHPVCPIYAPLKTSELSKSLALNL